MVTNFYEIFRILIKLFEILVEIIPNSNVLLFLINNDEKIEKRK